MISALSDPLVHVTGLSSDGRLRSSGKVMSTEQTFMKPDALGMKQLLLLAAYFLRMCLYLNISLSVVLDFSRTDGSQIRPGKMWTGMPQDDSHSQ